MLVLVFVICFLNYVQPDKVTRDWWEDAVIYKIYVRSFMDSNGDGIGDINGIKNRLDYIQGLGVNAIWLSPIFESSMSDMGFDVTDHYKIDKKYGHVNDLIELIHKASESDIKVILDLVPNHTSDMSDWFIKSKQRDEYYDDWYIWASGYIDEKGDKKPPNNWVSVFGGSAWTYVTMRDQFYLHQFRMSQPDLNYRNPIVVDEMKNVIKFWLERGIAGLALNSVNHVIEAEKEANTFPDEPLTGKPMVGPNDYNYLKHIHTKDQDENYDVVSHFRDVFDSISLRNNITRVMITEASTNIKNSVRYYGDGARSGTHVPYNFDLIHDLNRNSDARDFKHIIDRWITYTPLNKPTSWATGNHDTSRVSTRFGPNLVDAFNMLVLLLPGIAITYMGEEIGMSDGVVPWVKTIDPLACSTDDPVNFGKVSRDPFRTPFQWNSGKNAGFTVSLHPWLPIADNYETVNVELQDSATRSYLLNYKALINLRSRPAFRYGKFTSLALNKDVFAFKRWYKHETYIVVMNIGKNYQTVNLKNLDLVFGSLTVQVSSILSSRHHGDRIDSESVDLQSDEALVLRMDV